MSVFFLAERSGHEEGKAKETTAGAYRKRDKRAHGAKQQRLKRAKGGATRRK
ncbi:hypothetical protein [Bacillus pumilus]|uniref:hypothetical protein n=1 Tax=Bacillus pumilus TaxID=1408 RepID=UPI00391703CA